MFWFLVVGLFDELKYAVRTKNKIKTNIMPLTESIMLFYREAFPMSYHALSVCGLRSNLEQRKSPVQ